MTTVRDDAPATITLTGTAEDTADVARTFARRMAMSVAGVPTDTDTARDVSIAVGHLVESAHVDAHTPVTLTMTPGPGTIEVGITMTQERWDSTPPEVRSLIAAIASSEPVVESGDALHTVFATQAAPIT